MTQFWPDFYEIRTWSVGAQDECLYQVWHQSTEKCAKKVWKVEHFWSFGTKHLKIRKKIKIHISTKPVIYVILINKESLYLKFERKNSKNEVRNAKSKFDLILTVNDPFLTRFLRNPNLICRGPRWMHVQSLKSIHWKMCKKSAESWTFSVVRYKTFENS